MLPLYQKGLPTVASTDFELALPHCSTLIPLQFMLGSELEVSDGTWRCF
jgi:hypothetical protein